MATTTDNPAANVSTSDQLRGVLGKPGRGEAIITVCLLLTLLLFDPMLPGHPCVRTNRAVWLGIPTWLVILKLTPTFSAWKRIKWIAGSTAVIALLVPLLCGVLDTQVHRTPLVLTYLARTTFMDSIISGLAMLGLGLLLFVSEGNNQRGATVAGMADKGVASELHGRMRSDIRQYATQIVQIVVLLVTTCTVTLGWFAVSLGSKQFEIAQQLSGYTAYEARLRTQPKAVLPTGTDIKQPNKQTEMGIMTQLDKKAGTIFADRISQSGMTAAAISVFGIIFSVMLCTICVLGYMIANRRQHSHRYGNTLSMAAVGESYTHPDFSSDRVLTGRTVIAFGILLGIISSVLTYAAGELSCMYLDRHGLTMFSGVVMGLYVLAMLKYLSSSHLLVTLMAWEYKNRRRRAQKNAEDVRADEITPVVQIAVSTSDAHGAEHSNSN